MSQVSPRSITVAELIERPRPQIVDVRSTQEFDSGHIPGAINIPMESIDSRLPDVDPAVPTVLVCQSGNRANVVCQTAGHYFSDVAVLTGGTVAWESEGNRVVRTTKSRKPLQQQALLAAGAMNLVAALLAILVSPNWLALNLIVSAGLITAGATGFCLMAQIMAVMPWNRRPTNLTAQPQQ